MKPYELLAVSVRRRSGCRCLRYKRDMSEKRIELLSSYLFIDRKKRETTNEIPRGEWGTNQRQDKTQV